MYSTPGKDTVNIAEIITYHLEYNANFVDKAMTEFKRTDSSFKIGNSTVGKKLSKIMACYREIFNERKCQLI